MAKKKTETWQARLGTSLNPIQVLEMQDAVRARETRVRMEGKWFELRYSSDGETVQYVPLRGFVPTGYLNIAKLLRSL
jgi:hypothetical protein